MIRLVDKDLRVLKYCKEHIPSLNNNNYLSGSFSRLVNLKYIKEKTDDNKEIYYKITKLGLGYLQEQHKLDSIIITKTETNKMELTKLEIKILQYVENHSPVSDNIFYEFKEEFEDYSHCKQVVESLVKLGYLYKDTTPQDDYYKITEFGITSLYEIGQASEIENTEIGYKESEGKLHVEYPWDYLRAQMERIGQNKHKYPKDNWKKPMDIEELKAALFRHTLDVMNGNYQDGTELGHLEAIGINAGLIWYQLKNNKQK